MMSDKWHAFLTTSSEVLHYPKQHVPWHQRDFISDYCFQFNRWVSFCKILPFDIPIGKNHMVRDWESVGTMRHIWTDIFVWHYFSFWIILFLKFYYIFNFLSYTLFWDQFQPSIVLFHNSMRLSHSSLHPVRMYNPSSIFANIYRLRPDTDETCYDDPRVCLLNQ